ncbi:aliphatic sulfonate ABC transporter substrate-binding protein [Methylocella sp.]|jgi:sulfonate transport system substrate-binding protein|uniref:aliphatic sulfonate ABC transporter substrate-binding protein n=1 Tax=Methylocella sp. TaxID=1978226 RepID=UPI003C16B532
MHRRDFLSAGLGAAFGGAIAGVWPPLARAAELKEIRIGYQKAAGILFAVKQRQTLENALKAQNIGVKWVEFQFGPPILEAIATGNVDFGFTGDAPPIFAQAAGANIVYVAALPANLIEGIVVHPDSPIHTLADLKGKTIGVAKASSAHNSTVAALEKAGLSFSDVKVIYLPPADAVAAFARGSIDAWAVWDPYLAVAEKGGARVVSFNTDVEKPYQYFLAAKSFAQDDPALLTQLIDILAKELDWARANRAELAQTIHDASGVDLDALLKAEQRAGLTVEPLNDDIIANQQASADRFFKLALIPKQIAVRDIVWKWTPSS